MLLGGVKWHIKKRLTTVNNTKTPSGVVANFRLQGSIPSIQNCGQIIPLMIIVVHELTMITEKERLEELFLLPVHSKIPARTIIFIPVRQHFINEQF